MNISLLGTGLMGSALAKRLLKESRPLTVFNRTVQKVEDLRKEGALVAKTSLEAIKNAECILLTLSDKKAIYDVLFQGQGDFLSGKTIIQMGTIAPAESIEIQKKVFEYAGEYFECPVLGSRSEALDGRLIVMVGSTPEKFERWKGFLNVFGQHIYYIGEVGKAALLKLALNHLIACHAASFSLSLGLIEKGQVNWDIFMHILRESSLYAPMFDKKLPLWLKRDYENPNFPVKHLLKDVDLILQEASHYNLEARHLDAVRGLLKETCEQGLGESDYSAVFNIINKIFKS